MSLREEFERRDGKLEDKLYNHVLELALDDLKQYIKLTQAELDTLMDQGKYPPSNSNSERLSEVRERLLESMAIIADIVTRRKLH